MNDLADALLDDLRADLIKAWPSVRVVVLAGDDNRICWESGNWRGCFVVAFALSPLVSSLKVRVTKETVHSMSCSSVPEGRNVYRISSKQNLKAPEERNVRSLGILRSSGAEIAFRILLSL